MGNNRKETIEEMKKVKYLGYIMQKDGGAEEHIKEKSNVIIMKRTWKESVQKRFQKKIENVQDIGGKCDIIRHRNMGMRQ